jgi:ABC-2 type transport system permease protein
MNSDVRTAVTMGLREYRRTPVLLGLLVVLPVYFISVFMYIVPTATLTLPIDGNTVSVTLSEFVAVLMTPVTAGLLSGIVGLFLMQSSKAADDRLRLAGYRSRDLIVSRVSLLAAGGVVVSTISLLVVLVGFVPTSIPAFVAATVLTALTYGVFGVIVGVSLDRLSGVYVMLFAPYVDLLLFQNPLSTESPTWATVLPGHFAMEAVLDAAFVTGVDTATFAWAIGYLAVALLICIMVFHRVTQVE